MISQIPILRKEGLDRELENTETQNKILGKPEFTFPFMFFHYWRWGTPGAAHGILSFHVTPGQGGGTNP